MEPSVERIYREESGRILATLIRLIGSFDLAEEVMQEAFTTALEQWPKQGIPDNPRAWLVATAHHKAVDLLRRRTRFDSKRDELQRLAQLEQELSEAEQDVMRHDATSALSDDRLRLVFTCCHPALLLEAQVALTLRTLCGLTTEEIASAFLLPLSTMAQRLVRAKHKIRDAQIPYRVPPAQELGARLEAVLLVVYLVFNEGYSASSGDTAIRRELCAEAIRVGRLVCELLPAQEEARALLALMLLHDSRRATRVDSEGEVVLLEDQDRSQWDREEIREGLALVGSALRGGAAGTYALQAAIAAVHAQAERAQATDWKQIVGLYEALLRVQPSPVVELNHAAAVAMAHGPAEGLRLLDRLEGKADLREYYLLPAARGDLLRRMQQWNEAALAYRRALALAKNEATRSFLSRRLAEMEARALGS
ncbi:MAG TPA: RNA polymerase sigma factor [Terriglobales bacterium]|nr:RNA polymerase sigma factor [Terriglobales bacterium]